MTRVRVTIFLLLAACSHSRRGGEPDASVGDLSAADLTYYISDSAGMQNEDATCAPQCSTDFRSIVSCSGATISTCAADEGCSGGACEPACQAAIDNHSAVGCEYYAVNPPDFIASCFAAYVANTWSTPVTVGVDYNGTTLDVTKFAYTPAGSGTSLTLTPLTGALPAGGIAILFLSRSSMGMTDDVGCPGNVAVFDASFAGTATGHAFHITTSEPVITYDIFPYGGGGVYSTSATLLLPVSVWDVNYVAVTGYIQTIPTSQMLSTYPWISIVAAQDNTTVTMAPTVAIVGGTGVAAAAANTPTTYTMSAGEVLTINQPDDTVDLTGSPISADKPIGVWGGNGCTNLPTAMDSSCDGMHQQIPPVKALGHEYEAVRYRNRVPNMEETPPWRIVGIVDGTTLTYDPPQAGAPTTLSQGQLVEFSAAGPFDVQSQDALHPFYFAAHMTSNSVIGGNASAVGNAGDPEFVNVIPPEQYLNEYVFFTDPTYPETDLVFVRENVGGFADVTLDCVGTITGWQPIGTAGEYEYTRVDLVTGNFVPQGSCNNGRHEAHSDKPFTITVWGWGSSATRPYNTEAVSYAYPAGAGVKSINSVIVPVQ